MINNEEEHSKLNTFEKNVFINCPYDEEYKSLLRPLLFTIICLGHNPRISSERSDSTENRIDKICELINESKYGIHDLSRIKSQESKDTFVLICLLNLALIMEQEDSVLDQFLQNNI